LDYATKSQKDLHVVTVTDAHITEVF